MNKVQEDVASLYSSLEKARYDNSAKQAFFAILQENIINHPSAEFIEALVAEECRRFKEGYDPIEGLKLWPNNSCDPKKKECSYTVSYILLTYSRSGGFDAPVIERGQYECLVTHFLNLLPLEALNYEILSSNPFTLKYDYYTPVSLVFDKLASSLQYNFELREKLKDNPALVQEMYQDPETKKIECPFWLKMALKLLKRGGSIDRGYIWGGRPVFVEYAKNWYTSYLCPLLLDHLKEPNRSGPGDVTAIHMATVMGESKHVLEGLLQRGANIEGKCSDGIFSATKRTPLELAATVNNVEATETLLKHKANPNNFSARDTNASCFSHEPILTPYQAAVSQGNPEILTLFFNHRDQHNVALNPTLDPREQALRDNKLNQIRERGEATLSSCAAAIQVQTKDNVLKEVAVKTGLFAYAEDEETRYELSKALLWLFNDAKNSAATKIWMPILNAFQQEIQLNKSFKVTAMSHRNKGACYNNDTQSDIYVYPNLTEFLYAHAFSHEVAHFYSFKVRKKPDQFLEHLMKAMERDGLLDPSTQTYQALPGSLRELLAEMRACYKREDYSAELFPRVCVQFPILHVLNNPECSEDELMHIMRDAMPETFKLYCELVIDEPELAMGQNNDDSSLGKK
jgi:hypothetical protein